MKETNTEEFKETPTKIYNINQRPALTLDVDYYQSLLNDEDISDEQKAELIETLWSIITSVIGFGFGVHPLQQTENEDMKRAREAVVKLVSDATTENEFQHASECKEIKKQKGELCEKFGTK